MKRIGLILGLLVAMTSLAKSQQAATLTQYMFYDYVINPGVAGTHNYYQIRSNHRFQWVGIQDPPLTNTISMYGPFAERDMGWGGYISSDVTGPLSYTSVYGSYAYNYPITSDMKISGGLAFGFNQVRLDGKKVTLLDEEDPLNQQTIDARYFPNANIGAYLYSSNYHVGLSVHQLITNKVRFYKNEIDTSDYWGRMRNHFFLTGGYVYFINRDFAIESTTVIKAVKAAPIQLDISTKVIYQNMAWLGLSFRTMDAISIFGGYTYENKIYIGYSYDIGVSDFRRIKHGGTHELMVGYKFNPIKK